MNAPVEILLSTCNGEKYLSVQIESILLQDYTNWKLIIRDDGSKDATLSIISDYIKKYPEKISHYADAGGNLGFCGSFMALLQQSSADYVMFCDQDDFWNPSKISTMLSVMLEEEAKLPSMAHLVFSDLQVTDAALNMISESFLKMTDYSPEQGMQIFFLKNYVPGCNMMFNRKLIQQAFQTNNYIGLHDHWLIMICGSVGKVTFINKSLMKYRIHDSNAIGFFRPQVPFFQQFVLFFKDNFKYGLANKKYRKLLYVNNIRQMQDVCECFGQYVSRDATTFSKIEKSNYFVRKAGNIIKPYVLENTLLKQITYIICF